MRWTAHWKASELSTKDWADWDELIAATGRPSVHLDSRCARALLASESRQAAALRWWSPEGLLVGVAIVEDAHAESRDLEGHLVAESPLFAWAVKGLHGGRGRLRFPLRVMGPVLGSGDHAFRFHPSLTMDQAKSAATTALRALPIQNGFRPRAFLIKDFPIPSGTGRVAGGGGWMSGWTDLEFDPQMRFPVNPDWSQIDSYMGELKTKSRTKVKRILTCSGDCEIEEISAAQLRDLSSDLIGLYKMVFDEAGFRLGGLTAEDLLETKKTWGDAFRISTLRLGGELLGFQCGFLTAHTVEAFFAGFDRDRHRELALYQRMLVEFVRWGIETGAKEVMMGRTALDIKSSVGGMPERLACVVKFRNPLLHALARLAARISHPTQPQLKQPWKQSAFAVSDLDAQTTRSKTIHSAVHSAPVEA